MENSNMQRNECFQLAGCGCHLWRQMALEATPKPSNDRFKTDFLIKNIFFNDEFSTRSKYKYGTKVQVFSLTT